jgi:hypothetical protein
MRPESVRYGSDRGRRGRMVGAGVTRRATPTAERAALDGKPRAANSHTSLTQDVFQREQSRSVDDHDDRSASAAGERPGACNGSLARIRRRGVQSSSVR